MKPRDWTSEEQAAFEPDNKVGLLATLDEGDLPHLSLITTLRAKGARGLVWGQFCEGASKRNVARRARVGFLIMTLDRRLWRGRARWTHAETHGEDYERFNRSPMFRYNAYFGIHTVHHMEVDAVEGPRGLPLLGLGVGMARAAAAALLPGRAAGPRVLNAWSRRFLSAADTLSILSFVGADGVPEILPLQPCRAIDDRRLIFAPVASREAMHRLAPGQPLCVFGLNLAMESVCVRGRFAGFAAGRLGCGLVELDWVYNSMPPKQGRIYPPQPLKAVKEF